MHRYGPDLEKSDKTLAACYNDMVARSATFAALDKAITGTRNIVLVDSTADQDISYDHSTHTITTPLNKDDRSPYPIAEVRGNLLWEMHNAFNGGTVKRVNMRSPEPLGPTTSMQDKKLYPFRLAAGALATEWMEWMMIAEYDLRAAKVDAQLASDGHGPHVNRPFQARFTRPEEGWFLFRVYLQEQAGSGHTSHYDPAAGNKEWKGWTILKVVEYKSPATLTITGKQVQDWIDAKVKRMKSPSNNPFLSDTIVDEASYGT